MKKSNLELEKSYKNSSIAEGSTQIEPSEIQSFVPPHFQEENSHVEFQHQPIFEDSIVENFVSEKKSIKNRSRHSKIPENHVNLRVQPQNLNSKQIDMDWLVDFPNYRNIELKIERRGKSAKKIRRI